PPAWRNHLRRQSGRGRRMPGSRSAGGSWVESSHDESSMRSGPDTPEQSLTDCQVDLAILDDDADFRTYMEDALRDDTQYAVRTYAQPEDLYAGCEHRLPDIVLLDMKMGEN